MTNEQNMLYEYTHQFQKPLNPFDPQGYPSFWYMKIFDIWEYVRNMSEDDMHQALGVENSDQLSDHVSNTIEIHTLSKLDGRMHRAWISSKCLFKFIDRFKLNTIVEIGTIQPNTDLHFEYSHKKFVFKNFTVSDDNILFMFFMNCLIRKYHKKIMV